MENKVKEHIEKYPTVNDPEQMKEDYKDFEDLFSSEPSKRVEFYNMLNDLVHCTLIEVINRFENAHIHNGEELDAWVEINQAIEIVKTVLGEEVDRLRKTITI